MRIREAEVAFEDIAGLCAIIVLIVAGCYVGAGLGGFSGDGW